jgi:hypothetical protein
MSLTGKVYVGEHEAEASFVRCSRLLIMLASLAAAMIFLQSARIPPVVTDHHVLLLLFRRIMQHGMLKAVRHEL